jgi:hypothetical protein
MQHYRINRFLSLFSFIFFGFMFPTFFTRAYMYACPYDKGGKVSVTLYM